MVNHGKCRGLVVTANVLADPSGDSRDTGFLPGGAFSDTNERFNSVRNVIGRNDTASSIAIACLDSTAVIRVPQSTGLIDRRMSIRIMAGRKRAGDYLGRILLDTDGVLSKDGFGRFE